MVSGGRSGSAADNHWQVQEAKQRFSELLRAAEKGDFQYITRHGKEVAVLVDIESFHQKVEPEPTPSLLELLLRTPPELTADDSDEFGRIMDEIEAARAHDLQDDPFADMP